MGVFFFISQAPVVQKVDSTIHWINFYPLDTAIILDYLTLIRWIVIYPVGSAIQRLNNRDLNRLKLLSVSGVCDSRRRLKFKQFLHNSHSKIT